MNENGRSIIINIFLMLLWSHLIYYIEGHSVYVKDSSETAKDGMDGQKEIIEENIKLTNNNEYTNTTAAEDVNSNSSYRRFKQLYLKPFEFDYYIPMSDRLTPENAEKYFEVQAKLQKFYNGRDPYNEDQAYWERFWQTTSHALELAGAVEHIDRHTQTIQACHIISVSYLNAIMDIKDYYKMRYFYANNLDYEVGYLVQEIVFRYQTALELFAIARNRFENKTDKYYAPSTLMLYMYTHVLDECKQIIHLCNMLHELEKRYLNMPKTPFTDYHIEDEKRQVAADKAKAEGAKYANEAERQEKIQKRLERKRKKEAKKRRKNMKKYGFLFTTTKKPRKRKLDLTYGWSIEDW